MDVAGLIFVPHPHFLQINITFKDVQIILLWLFDISSGFKFTKNLNESFIHVIQWFMILGITLSS